MAMRDAPTRKGYRLKYDYEMEYRNWQDIGGCTCFRCAPCSSCCHDGNPISLEENDEAWELLKPDDYMQCTDDASTANLTYGKIYGVYKTNDPNQIGLLNDKGNYQYYSLKRFGRVIQDGGDMSRVDIVDKSGGASETKVSPWFGYKYKVTPETSKLLQEAVFKGGGGWRYFDKTEVRLTESTYLFVDNNGNLSHQDNNTEYFNRHILPEKQPPSVDKTTPKVVEYKAGDKVRIIGNGNNHAYNIGDIVTLKVRNENKIKGYFYWDTREIGNISCVKECDMELVIEKQDRVSVEYKVPDGYIWSGKDNTYYNYRNAGWTDEQLIETWRVLPIKPKENPIWTGMDLSRSTSLAEVELALNKQSSNINQQEEVNMSNARKVVNIKLLDNDQGLPVEYSLVAEFNGVVTEDDNETTIRQILMDEDVAGMVAQHNEIREGEIDRDILRRTGNKVTLQAVKLKQLTWVVTQA